MLQILEKATSLSEKISLHIEQDDWKNVEKLQLERDRLLAKLPKTKLPDNESDLATISQLSLKVKELTKAQLAHSEKRKESLLREIKNNNTSKKMKATYQPS